MIAVAELSRYVLTSVSQCIDLKVRELNWQSYTVQQDKRA